jgi:hypothetical protein
MFLFFCRLRFSERDFERTTRLFRSREAEFFKLLPRGVASLNFDSRRRMAAVTESSDFAGAIALGN